MGEAVYCTVYSVQYALPSYLHNYVNSNKQTPFPPHETAWVQVHVLTFTVHNLIHNMAEKSLLKPGDLDSSIHMITEVALTEMFGVTAEEKEVKKITGAFIIIL